MAFELRPRRGHNSLAPVNGASRFISSAALLGIHASGFATFVVRFCSLTGRTLKEARRAGPAAESVVRRFGDAEHLVDDVSGVADPELIGVQPMRFKCELSMARRMTPSANCLFPYYARLLHD